MFVRSLIFFSTAATSEVNSYDVGEVRQGMPLHTSLFTQNQCQTDNTTPTRHPGKKKSFDRVLQGMIDFGERVNINHHPFPLTSR